MDYISRIRQAIDYIEEHLEQDINLADVARTAGISQWHFQRIFKSLSNETLKFYIRARRLSLSLDRLTNSNERIIDIALNAGFGTQESFTRAFKKHYNMTPNEYRSTGKHSLFLKKLQLDENYLQHINNNLSLTPVIQSFQTIHCIGMHTCFYGIDSEKNNLADKLPKLWGQFLEHMDNIGNIVGGTGYGIIAQTDRYSEKLNYYAAIEVSCYDSIPKGMLQIDIPAAKYAVFEHKGDVKNINNTVNYIYSNWLFSSGMQHTEGPDIEIYGADYLPDSEQSVIHYAVPVK